MKKIVLLIHGFGGTPEDLGWVAAGLKDRGAEVTAPLLPGHGTNVKDLQKTAFQDWYLEVEKQYRRLKQTNKAVHVVGFSMGGTLALRLAQLHDPASVTAIAAPVYLHSFFPFEATDWGVLLVPGLRFLHPYHPMCEPDPVSRETAPSSGYCDYQPLHAINSFLRGMKMVRRNLRAIKSPVLVLQSPEDKTVLFRNAWAIVSGVSSDRRSLEIMRVRNLNGSAHMLPTHLETRERVQRIVSRFIYNEDL